MRRTYLDSRFRALASAALLSASLAVSRTGHCGEAGDRTGTGATANPWDRPGWELTFHDEFDGAVLDTSSWVRRYKWGEKVVNGELQAYVDDAFSVRDGILNIVGTAHPGQYAGKSLAYRSGVLCSVHEQRYGYFEARLKMPRGKGLWPAFWLLGNKGAGAFGEIDIQEFLGHDPTTIYFTVHWGKSYGPDHRSASRTFKGPDFTTDFHTFGLEWDEHAVIWTVDGVEQFRHEGVGVPHTEMYVILNLAVGGNWPKAPDPSTKFPAHYAVDYVRVFHKAPNVDAGAPVTHADAASASGGQPSAAPSRAPGSAAPHKGGCACRSAGSDRAPFGPRWPAGLSALGVFAVVLVRRHRGVPR